LEISAEKYGKWVLITGASSGIGEEFARKFAALGFNLVLIARRKDKLNKIARELSELHKVEIIDIEQDLSEDNFLENITSKIGNKEIGILINNAGLGGLGEFHNADSDHEAKMVKVNCAAPVILTHHFVKSMIERKKGAIIFLGSLLSFQPTPYSATYSATKVFNSFLGDSLWYELKKYNIDVLSLNPGGTDTEFLRLSKKYRKGPILRTTKDVVETALMALGRKPSVIDGYINKTTVFFGRLLPRKILIKMSGLISGKLHEQREADEKQK
jgi:short-subunit dehydrogenase